MKIFGIQIGNITQESTEANIKKSQIKMISFPLIYKVLAEFDQGVDPENKIHTIKTWQPELFQSLGYLNQNPIDIYQLTEDDWLPASQPDFDSIPD